MYVRRDVQKVPSRRIPPIGGIPPYISNPPYERILTHKDMKLNYSNNH